MKNEITLEDVLACREKRAKLQIKLTQAYRCPLISFTMNIAGPVKTSPLIRRAFYLGLQMLEDKLTGKSILYKKTEEANTGYEALYAVSENAQDIKKICVSIEESLSIGRLFDMDVIDQNGTKLDRNSTRGCIVCGAPGRACAATRSHSVKQLQAKTKELLEDFFLDFDKEQVGALAYQCLIDEVQTTPKPGLVDQNNTGSHIDMDLESFLKSASVLSPYFKNCFSIGNKTASENRSVTFIQLKTAGILAEDAMYRATDGVNTHKGMIYSLGLLCGAIGRLWLPERPFATTDQIFTEASLLAQDAAHADFAHANGKTAGERLYLQHKITGIRGQVCDGFPAVRDLSLPIFQNALTQGLNRNQAGVLTLLHLIARVEDTNLYHRGGESGAVFAKEYAKQLLSRNPLPSEEEVLAMDRAFIIRNLSPGGCADLLALTYFVNSLSKERL
ncbi:MAG: citrate lyase holo-[acyl-carrier protein] synthase [Ruminococcaceae bacterium]|nr:citrate lyase holo-[acyl-carrier protein] synthase [Oscillospiraceae bacterium]